MYSTGLAKWTDSDPCANDFATTSDQNTAKFTSEKIRCFGRKVHGKLRLRGRIRSSSQSIREKIALLLHQIWIYLCMCTVTYDSIGPHLKMFECICRKSHTFHFAFYFKIQKDKKLPKNHYTVTLRHKDKTHISVQVNSSNKNEIKIETSSLSKSTLFISLS